MQCLLEADQLFDKFTLAWRFVDENYHQLPLRDLHRITPYSAEEAYSLWQRYVSKSYDHVMQLTQFHPEMIRFEVDWENENQGQQLLKQHCQLTEDSTILCFWSPQVAVKTHWGLLTQYWTDFCYPDDDNNVIVAWPFRLYFCEEVFTIETHSEVSLQS